MFISKSIVEAHGGKIWAENNIQGIGAAFLILRYQFLIVKYNNDNDTCLNIKEVRFPIAEKSISIVNANRKKVLVVDDEVDANTTLKIILEENEFEVDAYINPLLALSNFKPGVYIFYFMMSEMPKIEWI